VPYAVASRPQTQIQIQYGGRKSWPTALLVGDSHPGIFTLDASGTGPGAIVNQNGTINTPSNPAPRGSIVAVYMTGEGATDIPGEDGKLALGALPKPLLPVTARIGGINATVEYAGAAPISVAGLMQVNLRIPQGVQPSDRVPILIQVGTAATPLGVTLAVQ
jgi:uncharacterized protein (TIGR03437 family)